MHERHKLHLVEGSGGDDLGKGMPAEAACFQSPSSFMQGPGPGTKTSPGVQALIELTILPQTSQ